MVKRNEVLESAGSAETTVATGITGYPHSRICCIVSKPVAVCQTMEPKEVPLPAEQSAEEQPLTENERRDLTDEEKQEEFRRAHLVQLRRFQCPGCGEAELF
jgi:hypothetical protein